MLDKTLIPFIIPDTLEITKVVTMTTMIIPHKNGALLIPKTFCTPPAMVKVPVPREEAMPATNENRQITSIKLLKRAAFGPKAGISTDPTEYFCLIL